MKLIDFFIKRIYIFLTAVKFIYFYFPNKKMGNRNYTCDYCQNTFKDTAELRKKHLNGLQHKINYEKHYVKFKGWFFLLPYKKHY